MLILTKYVLIRHCVKVSSMFQDVSLYISSYCLYMMSIVSVVPFFIYCLEQVYVGVEMKSSLGKIYVCIVVVYVGLYANLLVLSLKQVLLVDKLNYILTRHISFS